MRSPPQRPVQHSTVTPISEPPPSHPKVVLEDGTTIPERRTGAAPAPPLDDPRLDALVDELATRSAGTSIEEFGEGWLAEAFRREVATARLAGTPLACLAVRINHAAELDALFGTGSTGAACAELARRFRFSLRKKDHVGEWGPSGIMLVLPETPYLGAVAVADRLRDELERKPVVIPKLTGGTTVVPIALSFGAAAWGETMASPADLADAATLAAGR